ncbi:alpha-amlyase [Halobacillus fulvus]|nr:alpha-amlyase [Halobacillus fulvus]
MRRIVPLVLILSFFFLGTSPAQALDREERLWQDESIYYIQVDRFMNGEVANDDPVNVEDPEAFHGGDLIGVIEQLDYIQELGFTTIQLSPIMQNDPIGYHGYAVEDFRAVEEHFGSIQTAAQLVEEAHSRDLRVLFDFPVSYISAQHPWVNDPEKADWFLENESVAPGNPWQEGLPELDTSQPGVRQYLVETARWWIEETNVDGFRVDASENVSDEFYEQLAQQSDAAKSDFFLYTTTEGNDSAPVVNGHHNLDAQKKVREEFSKAGGTVEERTAFDSDTDYTLIHTVDSPKGTRFTHETVEEGQNPITRWELALTYTFTTPGVPMMMYGTEVPLDDGGNYGEISMMNFKTSNEQLKQRIEKLTSMREQFPVLTRGDYEEIHDEDGLLVYKRSYEDEEMLIAINNATKTNVAEVEDLPEDYQLRGLLQDGVIRQQDNGNYRIGMERETADVFIIESDRGYNWLFIGFVGGILSLFVLAVIIMSVKSKRIEKTTNH